LVSASLIILWTDRLTINDVTNCYHSPTSQLGQQTNYNPNPKPNPFDVIGD